jgi:hypothetical protein
MEVKNSNLQKRWIPAYYFAWLAENLDFSRLNFAETKPMMIYVGTVVPEKYVSKGVGRSTVSERPVSSTIETQEDIELDQKMYELMDFPGQNRERPDGRGYQYFFECLRNDRDYCNGAFAKKENFKRFNVYEQRALLAMASDWRPNPKTPQELSVRNSFGLDPVLFRRLLASFWNDPGTIFRPNILQTPMGTRQQIDNVKNFRLLLASPIKQIAQSQNVEIRVNGIPNEPMRCKDTAVVPESDKATCASSINIRPDCKVNSDDTSCINYDFNLSGEDAEFAGGWPGQSL